MKVFQVIIRGMPSINYFIEYGSTKDFERPKIKKGKDFYHNPEAVITGTIEGKKHIPPTLKTIFGKDVDGRIKFYLFETRSLNKLRLVNY